MGNSEETDQILTTCLLEISSNLVIRNKFINNGSGKQRGISCINI